MNPSNLGKQNGALVLEILQVLGRPATIKEVSQRVADIYKVARNRIQPVVGDVLGAGVRQGFFRCRNRRYAIVKPTIEQLRREIDEYVVEMLMLDNANSNANAAAAAAAGGGGQMLPKPSPLMIKLEQLDATPPPSSQYVVSASPSSGELRERTPPGD
ncbi:CG31407, partial [Drosophila busckii]